MSLLTDFHFYGIAPFSHAGRIPVSVSGLGNDSTHSISTMALDDVYARGLSSINVSGRHGEG